MFQRNDGKTIDHNSPTAQARAALTTIRFHFGDMSTPAQIEAMRTMLQLVAYLDAAERAGTQGEIVELAKSYRLALTDSPR